MTTQQALELEELGASYEIIGELAGRDDARTFIGKRKDDGRDVLVAVTHAPAGDEGNALSHLATDVKRLAGLSHRNLLPIVDGQWLNGESLAVVTQRAYFPTLQELLTRRDEEFSFPRVAVILQEINGVLEWARAQKIVHRAVGLDTVFVEPGSDRVLVAFAVRPLPLAGMPGVEEDAKTIATLASAMLTRSPADAERARLPLAEARPGLSVRLIEQTEALLQGSGDGTPDVNGYIATIAMAEALKRSETESEETTRKLLEEERVAREKLESERQATERAAAEQARLFQRERDEFAREKEKILRELAKERETVAKERQVLARERAEHAQDRATLLAEREDHKRWAQEVEAKLDSQGLVLKEQAEQVAALRQANVASESAPAIEQSTREAPIALPPRPKPRRVTPDWQRSLSHAWADRPEWNRKWNVPVGVLALLLVGVSAVAIGRGRSGQSRTESPNSAAVATAAPGSLVVDSQAGGVSPSTPVVAGIPADFLSGVVARSDSVARLPVEERPVVRPRAVARPVSTQSTPNPDIPTSRVDTVFVPGTNRTISPAAVGARRDSITTRRRDTIPKRDSVPPDPASLPTASE